MSEVEPEFERELSRASSATDSGSRLTALRRLLAEGGLSTQDELRGELAQQGFVVTQSTISRDLRRIGAVKVIDAGGQTVYRLPDEVVPPPSKSNLGELVLDIRANDSLIVIITPPGTASLVARHLDHFRPGGILGTIAGDDTIFVAPPANRPISAVVEALQDSIEGVF